MSCVRGAHSSPKWVLPLPFAPSLASMLINNLTFCSYILQASQMIVSYDEHDVKNTFKFGVIYQKARQVSTTNSYWSLYLVVYHQGLFFPPPSSIGTLH